MDTEEYKKMLHKRISKPRFSALQPFSRPAAERRMTIFNPMDPNNSAAAFRFLAKANQSEYEDAGAN